VDVKRKSRGGRPRKHEPEAGEKLPLGIRVTPEMKARLEEIAAGSGRSQSQEAEYRLERSFEREGLLLEALALAFGETIAGTVLLLGAIMSVDATMRGGIRGADDPDIYRSALDEAALVLSALRSGEAPKNVDLMLVEDAIYRARSLSGGNLARPIKKFIADYDKAIKRRT
jgi:hypothetical protein